MAKPEFTMKTSENRSVSVSRALDMLRASEYEVAVTDFYSPGEIMEIYAELCTVAGGAQRCFFWGGAVGAERRAAVFLPEWYMPDDAPKHSMPNDAERCAFFAAYLEEHPEIADEIPIRTLSVKGSSFRELGHRDYMGSILSLGIDRSVVGDIAVVSPSEAVVFVSSRIAPYIESELTKIGRDGVSVTDAKTDPVWEIPRRFCDMPVVVSSPRLDGIVKAITGKSREDAADLVRSGLVELSYAVTDNVSAEVKEGDVISVRGYGKFLVGAVTGETKSGRLRINCRKYM